MQLEFSWRDGDALRAELERHTGCSVELVITDNRHNMLTVKRPEKRGIFSTGRGLIHLRLHRMFLAAEPEVVSALGQWLKSPRSKRFGTIVDAFIREHIHEIRTRAPRAVLAVTRGAVFDLDAIYRRLNAQYFDNSVTATITWGRMSASPRRRKRSLGRCIRFGSYSKPDNLIRIHPVLDAPNVPDFFVEFIVYHEMLHAVVEFKKTPSGQLRCHTREFREREQAFDAYKQAIAWQDEPRNLNRLFISRGKK